MNLHTCNFTVISNVNVLEYYTYILPAPEIVPVRRLNTLYYMKGDFSREGRGTGGDREDGESHL